MVYLVIDPATAGEVIEVAQKIGSAVWVGSDAMSHNEHYRIAASGVNLTRFEYPLSGVSAEVIAEALATVAEHHPGESIWVQHMPINHD